MGLILSLAILVQRDEHFLRTHHLASIAIIGMYLVVLQDMCVIYDCVHKCLLHHFHNKISVERRVFLG